MNPPAKPILAVVGARPQFVKAAVVSKALKESGIPELLVHTGQHYDERMSNVFFRELSIAEPAFNLGVGSGPHGRQTGEMLAGVEELIERVSPAAVLVYGDTNSTLAGALAASKMFVPVIHVEAGLRSFNRRMPEEVNRILTDHISDLLLVPTEAAADQLRKEGISGSAVCNVGDVMFDATLLARRLSDESAVLDTLRLSKGEYVLLTVHRAENTDDVDRFSAIVEAMEELALTVPVIFPAHPRTIARLRTSGTNLQRVRVIEPVSYLEMVTLESSARLVVTDSGGVQKEAYFAGVQCVTLRGETEWTELVTHGWNRLAPPDSAETILAKVFAGLNAQPGDDLQLYGNGRAAEKIAAQIKARYY